MLRNEKYTGVYLYSPQQEQERGRTAQRVKEHAIRIEDAFPAIIDREAFKEVQKIMDARKQTGRKASYLCSGLVYCTCGAKMHATASTRNGSRYAYYTCSQKCGRPNIRMEEVDKAAKDYLRELLTPDNQNKIAEALRAYSATAATREEDFKAAVKQKIREKQGQYDALMNNLATGAMPGEIAADIGRRMQQLKQEMDALGSAEAPKDYTVEQVGAWLESIKAVPDEKAVHLLIEKMNINSKTDFNIQSTLKSVLSKHGCGTRI